MDILSKRVLGILVVLMASMANAQQGGAQPAVEMQYCGMKAGRPPLEYLRFDIALRNSASKPQWFLFPAALYEKPTTARKNAGIDVIELLSDSPEHKVTVVHFMGTMNLQADGAGGFKGVLLPAGAAVSIHGFEISFWGEAVSPLAMRVVTADKITIGGIEVGQWVGKDLLSAKNADVTDLDRAGSKSTDELKELPVEITKSGEVIVADALAKKCAK